MTSDQLSTEDSGTGQNRSGFIVVGIDGSPEAAHALAWAADHAAEHGLGIEVITTWNFPAIGIELPSTGRLLHKQALEMARHAVEVVTEQRAADGKPAPPVNVEAYLSSPAERLVAASSGADLLVVGRGRASILGSTSRGVIHHATCPVAVIPSPDPAGPSASLTTRFGAEHPRLSAAIEAVSRHLSAMGI